MAVERSRSSPGLFRNVVEAGIRPGFSERLFRHDQDALAVLLRVGIVFGWALKKVLANGDCLRLYSKRRVAPL
jgi:hypothetical protein